MTLSIFPGPLNQDGVALSTVPSSYGHLTELGEACLPGLARGDAAKVVSYAKPTMAVISAAQVTQVALDASPWPSTIRGVRGPSP